eukprot:4924824-Pyramimonas_sp.AAC.1
MIFIAKGSIVKTIDNSDIEHGLRLTGSREPGLLMGIWAILKLFSSRGHRRGPRPGGVRRVLLGPPGEA